MRKQLPDDKRLLYERFAGEYINNGGNASAAVVTLGIAEKKVARTAACRLLQIAYVQQLIQEHQDRIAAELNNRFAITRENVLEALSNLVFGSPKSLFNDDGTMKHISELDDRTAKMISSFEVEELFEGRGREREKIGVVKKIRLWDKNSAIDKAMRHLGLFEKDNNQKPPVVQLTRDDAGVL